MPPENNQNFNNPAPQQPQKSGSVLNTILLILLIALVGFGIWFLSEKKDVSEDNMATQTDNSICVETKNSIEKLSNFSFENTEKKSISINNVNSKVLCTYYTSQPASNPEDMHKLSGIFEKHFTTNGWSQDLSESADGIDGGQFGYYKGDLKVVFSVHYIDQSTTLTYSLPFPRQFEIFVQIIEDSQTTQNSTPPNTSQLYEDTPESQVTQEQSDAYIVNFEKRIDGFNYITLDYVTKGNGVGVIVNENQKLRTFRASNNLKVQVADSSVYIAWEEYVKNIKKYNEIWIRSGSNVGGVEYNMASSVYSVKIQNGFIVEIRENIEPQG